MRHSRFLFVLLVLSAACSPRADVVFLNGAVYTVDAQHRWVEAVAIRSGKFIGVGTTDEIRAMAGPNTDIIDLEGKMVLPGLHDLHIHPLSGAAQVLYQCNFPSTASPAEIVSAVKRCADDNPERTWITGGRWGSAIFPGSNAHKSLLDDIAADRPIVLSEESGHLTWANSKALELAGITRDTPDPPGGVIMRDPRTGEPTGTLKEAAAGLVRRLIPPITPAERVAAARLAVRTLNEQGVTSIKDAGVGRESLDAYKALDDEGQLTIRVATSLRWRWRAPRAADRSALIDSRHEFRSDRLNTDFAKLVLDGVPTTSKTAAMLDPYVDDAADPNNRGMLFIDQETLNATVTHLDSIGITIKMHAAGDAAVRAGLDAIEVARELNGNTGLRHELGHAGFIHPDDLVRFDRLGAVMEVSPYIWYPTPITDVSIRAAVGDERTDNYWPVKSASRAGAVVVAGSDWPVVPDLNPWLAIEALVTRRDPDEIFEGVLGAHEAIDLAAALDIFTVNGAYAMRQEDALGSIAEGKKADLIVLDRILFEISPDQIGDTKVMLTVVDGRVVFDRENRAK